MDSNRARFESTDRVRAYAALEGLTDAESLIVERWVPAGLRVLDLGVGTGRTTPSLAKDAARYVGVDYAPPMIEAARQRYPGTQYEVGDAADLHMFDDASFDVVVFSYNGLDYLHPIERRSQALREIRRVLSPAGTVILSTHNPRAIVRRPGPDATKRGRLGAIAISSIGTARAARSLLASRAFWSGAGYAVDRVQGLLTYYESPACLVEELVEHGFQPLDLVSSDHPAPLRRLSTPWTYIVAVRAEPEQVKIERVAGAASIRSLAGAWDRLAAETETTVFQSRPWFEAWHDGLEPDTRPVVFAARRRDSERIVGLLATAQMRRRAHSRIPVRLRYIGIAGAGTGAADHVGPLAESWEIGARLLAEFRRDARRRTLLLENLSPRWAPIASAAVGGRAVRTTECPRAVRVSTGRFSDAWSAKMRKNVRRRSRQLEDLGITAEWVPAGDGFAAALGSLRALHSRRWGAEGTEGLFDDRRECFLLDFAGRCTPPDCPWILLLRRPTGDAVAGLLGFRHRDTFSVYKTGWDPALARSSPGIALGAEAMRWAEDHGLTVFDYLRGPRSHKKDLGCRPETDITLVRASGLSGQILALRERLSSDGVSAIWVDKLRSRFG